MMSLALSLALALGSVGTPMIGGTANYATASHGADYLAMRLPRGTVVDICGAGGCWRGARVNDFGPVAATGDIADIALGHFAHVCGWSIAKAKRMGECIVSVEIVRADIPLPATDTEEVELWHWLQVVR